MSKHAKRPAKAPPKMNVSTRSDQRALANILLGFAAIIVFTMVAYIPAMRAGFIWDDDSYVTNNPLLRDSAGLWQIWTRLGATPQYYPMVFTSFWIEQKLWGFDPVGYHITNIVLHALGASALWLLLRRLGLPGAWLAAALFTLHPVHVESVAWITERKNVLSALFYFLAGLAYLRFAPLDTAQEESSLRQRCAWYALAMGLFALALLSKTVTCTFPAAILLMIWWKRGRLLAWDLVPTIPFFAAGISMGLVTAWMERHHVWGGHVNYDYSFIERCLIAGRIVWFYAAKLVWPTELIFFYPRWVIDSHQWWQWLFPIGAIAVVLVLWKVRGRIGRGPLTAALFFGGTLFPAMGFFAVYPFQFSFVADHFQHLASVGILALAAAAITLSLARAPTTWRAIVPAAILGVLGFLTWRQCGIYADPIALWSDTLAKNPEAWIAHNNLAAELHRLGDFSGAEQHARDALSLRPDYREAHNNLGLALESQGKTDQAISEYRTAIALDSDFVPPRLNLARLLLMREDYPGAEEQYRQTIAASPLFADAHYNYAVFLGMRGRLDEAIDQAQTARRLNPDDLQIRALLEVLQGQ